MNCHALLIVFFASLYTSAAATAPSAHDSDVHIQIRLSSSTPTLLVAPWTLAISGVWPTACPPAVERVSVLGHDIRIEARSKLHLCPLTPTAYSFDLNPAESSASRMLDSGVYRVSVYTASSSLGPLHLRAFLLVSAGSVGGAQVTPESGFWWSESSPKRNDGTSIGLSIETQGETLSATLMSYNAQGDAVWYFGTGTLTDRTAHVPLLQLKGGGSVFDTRGGSPTSSPELAMDLEFDSSGRATAWFSRYADAIDDPELELRPITVMRLPFAGHADGSAWQGEWILVPADETLALQRLRFERQQAPSSDSFRLSALTGEYLQCRRRQGRQDSPPEFCQLLTSSGKPIAHFAAVAIDHLDGVMTDGSLVRLLRASR